MERGQGATLHAARLVRVVDVLPTTSTGKTMRRRLIDTWPR